MRTSSQFRLLYKLSGTLIIGALALFGCDDADGKYDPDGPWVSPGDVDGSGESGDNEGGNGSGGGGSNGDGNSNAVDPSTVTGVKVDPKWTTCNRQDVLENEILRETVPGVFAPISADELRLYELIMTERRKAGLHAIPLSPVLTSVARAHVWDSTTSPASGSCNMHSWTTDTGAWEPFCYTSDHAQMRKMHAMPQVLFDFRADGYENSAWGSPSTNPDRAIAGWMGSSGHRSVILNEGIWADMEWRAIGIGISGQYAHMWVSTCADSSLFPAE